MFASSAIMPIFRFIISSNKFRIEKIILKYIFSLKLPFLEIAISKQIILKKELISNATLNTNEKH